MERGLQRGAVAAGMLIEFTPDATPWEVLEVFRVAAKHGAAVHVHMRGLEEPYYFLETEEVIAACRSGHLRSGNGPRSCNLSRADPSAAWPTPCPRQRRYRRTRRNGPVGTVSRSPGAWLTPLSQILPPCRCARLAYQCEGWDANVHAPHAVLH
jgi:hypothetical protein